MKVSDSPILNFLRKNKTQKNMNIEFDFTKIHSQTRR